MASTKNLVHPFFLVDIKWGAAKVSKVESWSRRDRSCSQQPLQPWPETFGCKTTGQLSAFWIPSATSKRWGALQSVMSPLRKCGFALFLQMFGCKRPFYVKLLDSHRRGIILIHALFSSLWPHTGYIVWRLLWIEWKTAGKKDETH
jgi:hypothetical protein